MSSRPFLDIDIRYEYDGYVLRTSCNVTSETGFLDAYILIDGQAAGNVHTKDLTTENVVSVRLDASSTGPIGKYTGSEIVCYGYNGRVATNSLIVTETFETSPETDEDPVLHRGPTRRHRGHTKLKMNDEDNGSTNENAFRDSNVILFTCEAIILVLVWFTFLAYHAYKKVRRKTILRRNVEARHTYANVLNVRNYLLVFLFPRIAYNVIGGVLRATRDRIAYIANVKVCIYCLRAPCGIRPGADQDMLGKISPGRATSGADTITHVSYVPYAVAITSVIVFLILMCYTYCNVRRCIRCVTSGTTKRQETDDKIILYRHASETDDHIAYV